MGSGDGVLLINARDLPSTAMPASGGGGMKGVLLHMPANNVAAAAGPARIHIEDEGK